MFTGIVSDLGEVLEVQEKAEDLRRITIACTTIRTRSNGRLDRLFRHLPDGRGPGADRKPP